jgi:hypothetical protein
MDNKVFYNVVVPTLVTEASFIGITTLGDDSNFVNKLVEIRTAVGELLFNVVKMSLICDRCRKLGKEGDCNHLMGEIPYWQDQQRHKDIEKMMEGEYETYMRESKYAPIPLLSDSLQGHECQYVGVSCLCQGRHPIIPVGG